MPTLTVTLLCAVLTVTAEPDAVLEVKGRGAEGRPAYDGGGVLEFVDLTTEDSLVHLAEGEPLPLRLRIAYDVTETAPIVLTSRFGTEFWVLHQYDADQVSMLHTVERIDLRQAGPATAAVEQATVDTRYGDPLRKGLAGLRGRRYFLIEEPDGEWIDITNPPAFFQRRELFAKVAFTLANLSSFTVACDEVESTWEPGGPFRTRLTVTDADGDTFPVVNATAEVGAGDWSVPLATHADSLSQPSGWLTAELPETVPETVTVTARVSAMTPDGPVIREVSKTFRRGEGQRDLAAMRSDPDAAAPLRNAAGVVRETRALWVSTRTLYTREGIDTLVANAAAAGLNVLIPDIFVRSTLLAGSDLWPLSSSVEAGLDPLAYLIEQAHAKGLEVHPWFCVTYRDRNFRDTLGGVDVRMKGDKVHGTAADVHRPKYRDFVVDLMVGVARDYDVDGIHLDYIRAMQNCYCDDCRAEFQAAFGKPLDEATEDDWIAWQRGAVGDIVRRVAEGVRAVRPKAILSAAVFSGLRGGAVQGQDPGGWANAGWVDVVIPMDYAMDTLRVRRNEQELRDVLDDDDKLVTGLSLYQRSGEEVSPRTASHVEEQIRLVRGMGIHGYCLFVDTYLNESLIEMLRARVNQEPAVPLFR